MIKLIIFDLDGVLVSTKDMHYETLNKALLSYDPRFVISHNDHVNTFDGLPTKTKLEILTNLYGLPRESHEKIAKQKQIETINYIHTNVQRDDKLVNLFFLLSQDYKICVCSNSVYQTIAGTLQQLGVYNYVDRIYSNEQVRRPKPSCEIYLKCMIDMQVEPYETLILEDSVTGRKAAKSSGAVLCPIDSPEMVTLETINRYLERKNNMTCWDQPNMTIVIPCAGHGSRFQKAGYTFPKPLIDVRGKPMIQLVVDNININANYVFIIQKEHDQKYNFSSVLKLIKPDCKIITVDGVTEGAACTTLLAKEYITDGPLMIANSDQYVDWDSSDFMYQMNYKNIYASMLTFESISPKWSFAKLGADGYVCEVAEKNPISNNASVGIYYWSKGTDYVKYAEQMINKNIRVNNEFYVCPVFNEAILDGQKIVTYNVNKMQGLGTPEDLEEFLRD